MNKPQGGVDVEEPNLSTNDTSIQDYQLIRDRERRERKRIPRYESQNLIDFALCLVRQLDILSQL